MAVYSNRDITQAIKDGTIVCTPFNPHHVSEASLDFTLGYYYYRQEAINNARVYNPFSKQDVERYFNGPHTATPHQQWCQQNGYAPLHNIPPEHPIIVLRPGERVLAHTHEFVGIRAHGGAAEVKSRSSWGRNGVAVCFDAGWIDPGYINRITLEIYNLNRHESVVLPVGERVGQLIFHTTNSPVQGDYTTGRGGISGKYQTTSDRAELIRTWRPQHMLPRAYKDQRSLPAPIDGLAPGIY